jgi:glutamate N-acetyltransferase / amino-acid N-acetyltransferase
VQFSQDDLRVKLGPVLLMDKGQPLAFDKAAASGYLKDTTAGRPAFMNETRILVKAAK